MQPGVGLPRVFSLVMKRCFPRRFRDSAAQALELPQHHSGVVQVRHTHLGLVWNFPCIVACTLHVY